MQSRFSVRSTVVVNLVLHTMVIALLTFIMSSGKIRLGGLAILIALSVAAVAITVYTAKKLIKEVTEQIAIREAELLQASLGLKTISEKLDKYAGALDQRAVMLDDQQKDVDRTINTLIQHGNQMRELAAFISGGANDSIEKIDSE